MINIKTKNNIQITILKRKCFLICLKSGHLLFYDVYRTLSLDNNQKNNNIPILADRQLIGNIEKCLHLRRLDTTKTNTDPHTWRLQQPQIHKQQQQQLNNQQIIPSIDIFDLQTATPSILHTIQFRYTLQSTIFI
ncbi:unnamed protein product [Rotaria sordida]|uniref:Uncharacterized protein n=1 Tax=Rotaria sordida TaxID=392033 RepID=A0A815GYN0_9BILA|nr:unnamed protein product [Rotaria sordida]CAF4016291.1 unnamed protein product [Rotaria sordida]